MLFWKRSSSEEKQRQLQQQHEDELSQTALEAGGLPLQARKRLAEAVKSGQTIFSSDLSPKELFLTRQGRYQPVSRVMGSSMYRLSWQYQRKYTRDVNIQELTTLSQAQQLAAQLALKRLEQEASYLNAHGVVGVHFTQRDYTWESDLLEYTATGTAIKIPNMPPVVRPFLSDLSGQELWTLSQADYYPAGLVVGYSSFYVSLGSRMTQQLRGFLGDESKDQEIAPFTQAIDNARHKAMQQATQMAQQLNATDIVGIHLEKEHALYKYTSETTRGHYLDMSVHVSVIGTAITARKEEYQSGYPEGSRDGHRLPIVVPTHALNDQQKHADSEDQQK